MIYEEFRQQYEKQHPASVPVFETEVNEYPNWLKWAVLAMFVSASLVSGVHTVPTVWDTIEAVKVAPAVRDVIALASFFAVELAILLSAYLMVKGQRLFGTVILAVTFTVAMTANVQSVVKAFAANGDLWSTVVAVIMGIGAPLICLMAGKMFVNLHRADRVVDARARQRYRELCQSWDKEIEREWKRYQKDTSKSPAPSAVHLSNGLSIGQGWTVDTQPAASTIGHRKVPNASEIAREYFERHPDQLDTPARNLEPVIGVGKSTINNVQNELRGQLTFSTNGNGNGRAHTDGDTKP